MSSLETVTHGVTDDQLINATGIRNLAINMSDVRTKRLSKSYLHNECVIQKSNVLTQAWIFGFVSLFPLRWIWLCNFCLLFKFFFECNVPFFMDGKRLQEMLERHSDEPPGGPLGLVGFFSTFCCNSAMCAFYKLLGFGVAFASKWLRSCF